MYFAAYSLSNCEFRPGAGQDVASMLSVRQNVEVMNLSDTC